MARKTLASNVLFSNCLGAIALLVASAANAAVVETTYTTWDIFEPGGTARYFQVRHGDANPLGGAWEMAQKDGDTFVSGDHLGWVNGDPIAFTLTHNSATGELNFTMDGNTVTWALNPGDGYEKISILAKSNAVAGHQTTISNLQLDGLDLANNVLVANAGDRTGVFLTGEVFSDFTLTGQITLSWDALAGTPANAELQAFVGVANAVPIPATAWLLGSGLCLVGLRFRRRHESV